MMTRGVVKNWIQERGFGFIDAAGKNVFVHMSQIDDLREDLDVGETVYFDCYEDELGRFQARNVTTKAPPEQSCVIQYIHNPLTGELFAIPTAETVSGLVVCNSLNKHKPKINAGNLLQVQYLAQQQPLAAPGLARPGGDRKNLSVKDTSLASQQVQALQQLNILAQLNYHNQLQQVLAFQQQQQLLIQQRPSTTPPPKATSELKEKREGLQTAQKSPLLTPSPPVVMATHPTVQSTLPLNVENRTRYTPY